MARPPRLQFPGAVSHITIRAAEGRPVLGTDALKTQFLQDVEWVHSRMPFQLLAYCLMSNHIHLLIAMVEAEFSRIMHRILTRFAMRFNIQQEHVGHVFQSRFNSSLCLNDPYLMELLRYVHMNPVKAGLVARPEDWPWSSHLEYVGRRMGTLVEPAMGLGLFHPDVEVARRLYAQFVLDADGGFEPGPVSKDMTGVPPLMRRPIDVPLMKPLGEILASTAIDAQVFEEAILGPSKTRPIAAARRKVAIEALRVGHRPAEVAHFLNRSSAWIALIGGGLG